MRTITILLLLLLTPVVGCESKGKGVGATRPRVTGETWRPTPVAMRVYPTTRFASERDRPVLEARIELFDQMNDSIKGVGRFRLELFAGDDRTASQLARRLYRWDVNLQTLDDHRRFYDPVTRSYLFRLEIDDLSIASRATLLEVSFLPIDGPRLETRAVIARAR
jgi:hypothetical protein